MKQNTNTSFGSFNKRAVRCEIRNNTTSSGVHREEAHNNKYRQAWFMIEDVWDALSDDHNTDAQ